MLATMEYMLATPAPADEQEQAARVAQSLYRHEQFDSWKSKLTAALARQSAGLLHLHAIGQPVGATGQHYAGARPVPLSSIVGSEGRSNDFDRSFHPLTSNSKDRWISVASARQRGVPLPPVQLIQVGNTYYVRDGHHRISVAHALGEQYIDAEVTVWETDAAGELLF